MKGEGAWARQTWAPVLILARLRRRNYSGLPHLLCFAAQTVAIMAMPLQPLAEFCETSLCRNKWEVIGQRVCC